MAQIAAGMRLTRWRLLAASLVCMGSIAVLRTGLGPLAFIAVASLGVVAGYEIAMTMRALKRLTRRRDLLLAMPRRGEGLRCASPLDEVALLIRLARLDDAVK